MQQNKLEPASNASEDDYVDNPDDWDWDNPIVVRGKRPARSTFSVRFESGELTVVREAAEAAGMKTGEFIRNAALAAAGGETAADPVDTLTELVGRRGMRVIIEPASPPETRDGSDA
jgi:hypothetical protein